ncbi:MAG TPA: GNAT family N-acetyltransferase [Verrucomicrobiae bacterium]|nr:GNAT family N-acetyltransferase [Verrucomicrobiae bacterium]
MPVNSLAITLRPERPEDSAFLLEVYSSARKEELDATGWPDVTRKVFLGMQFNAQQQGYRATFPLAEFNVIEVGGQAAGRMVVNRAEGEFRLVDLALLPAHRGQGVGTTLIQNLLRDGAAAGKPVRLSVIKGERAFRLYERLGFKKTGEDILRIQMEWQCKPA